MQHNLTEIVFILDRSGSMGGLESDTIGGYNNFLTKQKRVQGEARMTTVLFDHKVEVLHDRVNINDVKLLTNEDYFVRGTTALYDAVGETINYIGDELRKTKESLRPGKVIIVIITDGLENASCKFSHYNIKEMINHQQTKYSWEFLFLGANFDAETFAESIAISRDQAARYDHSGEGVYANYLILDELMTEHRENNDKINYTDWKKKIKKLNKQ